MAERVRDAVANLAEIHALADGGIVTVSISVATAMPSSSILPEQLVAYVDTTIYEAKRTGRNRVVVGVFQPEVTTRDTRVG